MENKNISSFISSYVNNILKKIFIKEENIDLETLIKIFNFMNINIKEKKDLYDIRIYHEELKNGNLIIFFYSLIPTLKKNYYSHKLTCLHKNSIEKQKFPGINLLRQILKCNNLKLKPKTLSKGYNRSNGKKIIERYFIIEDLKENNENKENKEICEND